MNAGPRFAGLSRRTGPHPVAAEASTSWGDRFRRRDCQCLRAQRGTPVEGKTNRQASSENARWRCSSHAFNASRPRSAHFALGGTELENIASGNRLPLLLKHLCHVVCTELAAAASARAATAEHASRQSAACRVSSSSTPGARVVPLALAMLLSGTQILAVGEGRSGGERLLGSSADSMVHCTAAVCGASPEVGTEIAQHLAIPGSSQNR